jgi:hypothetical protein
MNSLTAHFLACLRRNLFELLLTAFAFPALARAEIRRRERGLQTGEILNSTLPPFVASMQRDFQIALQAQDGVPLREDVSCLPILEDREAPELLPPEGVGTIYLRRTESDGSASRSPGSRDLLQK